MADIDRPRHAADHWLRAIEVVLVLGWVAVAVVGIYGAWFW